MGSFLRDKNTQQIPSAIAIIAQPGGLIDDKAQKERIAVVKTQLKQIDCKKNWGNYKKIVAHAITIDGIHPNELNPLGENPLWLTLLYEKDSSDVDFARLLLEHGVNPNQFYLGYMPYLAYARTVTMAQLLFNHGAHYSVSKYGPTLLQRSVYLASLHASDNAVSEWYLSHDISPNEYEEGKTALHELVIICSSEARMPIRCAYSLMNAGGLLNLQIKNNSHWHSGYTVPQIIKRRLENLNHPDKKNVAEYILEMHKREIESLQQMRTVLIEHSNYRHSGLEVDLISFAIPRVLAQMIVNYYIYPESRYEELEAVPVPT